MTNVSTTAISEVWGLMNDYHGTDFSYDLANVIQRQLNGFKRKTVKKSKPNRFDVPFFYGLSYESQQSCLQLQKWLDKYNNDRGLSECQDGNKIPLIRRLRTICDDGFNIRMGLKEAKDSVEILFKEYLH